MLYYDGNCLFNVYPLPRTNKLYKQRNVPKHKTLFKWGPLFKGQSFLCTETLAKGQGWGKGDLNQYVVTSWKRLDNGDFCITYASGYNRFITLNQFENYTGVMCP